MLKRSKKRKAGSSSRSPRTSRDPHRLTAAVVEQSSGNVAAQMPVTQQRNAEAMPPVYENTFINPDAQMHNAHMAVNPMAHPHQQYHLQTTDAEHIWRGFEMTANEQLPVWISDQSLGGSSFSQNGMDAFLLPNDYLPPTPQIW